MPTAGQQPDRIIALISLIVVTVTTAAALSWQHNYNGSQVFRIQIPTHDKWVQFYNKLQDLTNTNTTFDIWRYSTAEQFVDVHIHGNDVTQYDQLLKDLGLKYDVTVSDVSRLIAEEQTSNHRRHKRSLVDEGIIGYYAKYDEILSWIGHVNSRYPTVTKVIDIGMTSEGRPMKILKIGLPGHHKWKMWLDGGIHAREWISPATVLYLANKLLDGYMKKDNFTTEILQKIDLYFLPVANPDGYEYSHRKDRLWRKNRSEDPATGCHGVDLNRNWRFQWGGSYSSDDPCDNVYRGSSPEDSVEVKNIVNFLSPRAEGYMAFVTYHSYGQRFITRWDYSKDVLPSDHNELMKVAEKAVDAMFKVHGTVYEPGRAPEMMYAYGGGSADWAKAIANIKYSYLIELRDHHSFILPASDIIPTGEENWAGLKVIAEQILRCCSDIPAPFVGDHKNWSRDNEVHYKIRNDNHEKSALPAQMNGADRVHIGFMLPVVAVLIAYWHL